MKKITFPILISCIAVSCNTKPSDAENTWFDNAVATAQEQLAVASEKYDSTGLFPRSLYTDYSLEQLTDQLGIGTEEFKQEINLREHPTTSEFLSPYMVNYADWTSGFFPGSLWLAYELTGDTMLRNQAVKYTNRLEPASNMIDTHDLGFMIGCSYGNAYRLAPNDSIKEVITRTAHNLASRFDKDINCIRSWDFGPWNYPVIIDNMMNLNLLFDAADITGDSTLVEIARRHADKTMDNHFRADKSCYHVVSYNNDGTVERRQTFQGKADDSAWSRGQGWAVYGYTEMYRNTRDEKYLHQAQAIADMIIERNKAADLIPYWDFDAKIGANTPKDASAAAVIASGFLELSTMLPDGGKYMDYAEKILKSLSTPEYLAEKGTNEWFILKHSTGSLPHGSEIDTPLNYADYYFLEALLRYKRIKNGDAPVTPTFK